VGSREEKLKDTGCLRYYRVTQFALYFSVWASPRLIKLTPDGFVAGTTVRKRHWVPDSAVTAFLSICYCCDYLLIR